MIIVRKSNERGHEDYGWLNTYYTFSFNTYFDKKFMGFRTLRVINEDVVSANQGFDSHPHKDMEIITYIVDGELTHQDSTGKKSTIKKGDVQVMTAGSGIVHSENNASEKPVHLLQIWITTDKKNHIPSHDEKTFKKEKNKLTLIVSNSGVDGSLSIHQDAKVYSCHLESGCEIKHAIPKNSAIWIQLIKGELTINQYSIHAGDGLSIQSEDFAEIKADKTAEFLMFELK